MTKTTSLEALIVRATELASAGRREIHGIAGAPGAGKSTLAAQLVAALGTDHAVLVPMDGFHLANVLLVERGLRQVKGSIETFDDAGYANLLERIRNQRTPETIYAPHFDRNLEEPIAGAIPVDANTPWSSPKATTCSPTRAGGPGHGPRSLKPGIWSPPKTRADDG